MTPQAVVMEAVRDLPGGAQRITAPAAIRTAYRPDIDGLRAVAVLLVVIHHAFPQSGGGFIGVDVFFVISGYLITGILAGDIRQSRFRLAGFYARRIRRIYPALLVVLLASLLAGWFLMLPNELATLGRHVAGGSGFVANVLYWLQSGYFDRQAELQPLLHLWSLGVEEQFYIVWPLLLAGLMRLPPRRCLQAVGALLLLSLLGCIVVSEYDLSAAFFLPHTRFWELAAGGWLALQQAGQRPAADGVPATGTGRWPQHAASVAGLSAIGLGAVLIDRHSAFPGAWALLPVGGALLLIQAGPAACINRHLLARAPMRWIGRISFSLYLWHWPLLVYGRIWLVGEPDWPQRLALVAVSVLLAWLSYRWIETPFRSAPTRRAPRPWSPGPVRFLAGMMAATFCAGVVLHLARGYPDRMPDKRDYIAFFDDYRYTRTHDLLRFDHHECNFYDIESGRAKTAIAATCLRPAAAHRRSVLLWGDSHAQHLAYGLDRTLPADVALLHVGASGCPPNVDDVHPDPLDSCNRANRLAWQAIGELHPDVVMLAQQGGHSITQYDALIARLHAGGVAQVVLIGPVPHWQPFLYQVVLKKYWQATPAQIGSNLDPAMFGLDAGLQRRYAGMPGVTYVSMIGPLCHDGACLAYLDGDRKEKLMTYDYAHFTLPASEFVVRTVVYPAMSGLLN
ncbi:acyltransferase family protein [Plasticicumulans sp.]|uniref:acyltransferase family protein n=1 Tax=Plasticicumulans sp. TaxID=2307179 RepID=UPI002CC21146|nr:acyltransferase family protein [Plasticicumulans sp.]HNM42762.1 acyltransferase family protein [Plasticicumulans sp.]HNO59732.1 acyltransferase family protein [Plasticicumulans sp.]